MEDWRNDTDREQVKYSEKNLSHCYFVHHSLYVLVLDLSQNSPNRRWIALGIIATRVATFWFQVNAPQRTVCCLLCANYP
jgi:hypothetical protein